MNIATTTSGPFLSGREEEKKKVHAEIWRLFLFLPGNMARFLAAFEKKARQFAIPTALRRGKKRDNGNFIRRGRTGIAALHELAKNDRCLPSVRLTSVSTHDAYYALKRLLKRGNHARKLNGTIFTDSARTL